MKIQKTCMSTGLINTDSSWENITIIKNRFKKFEGHVSRVTQDLKHYNTAGKTGYHKPEW